MSKDKIKHQKLLKQVDNYYSQKILAHGATHLGVDWNSTESQNLRFDQLLKITSDERTCSIIDYGCGYGALASYMRKKRYTGDYRGFDISKEMIKEAKKQQSKLSKCTFVNDIKTIGIADYTLASGIFNVKQEISYTKWQSYVIDTVDTLAKHSRKGFAFNMLTSYSDAEKMRPDLFYGDPLFFIDYCIRNYSRQVAMLQDYTLYEFTILVRLK